MAWGPRTSWITFSQTNVSMLLSHLLRLFMESKPHQMWMRGDLFTGSCTASSREQLVWKDSTMDLACWHWHHCQLLGWGRATVREVQVHQQVCQIGVCVYCPAGD